LRLHLGQDLESLNLSQFKLLLSGFAVQDARHPDAAAVAVGIAGAQVVRLLELEANSRCPIRDQRSDGHPTAERIEPCGRFCLQTDDPTLDPFASRLAVLPQQTTRLAEDREFALREGHFRRYPRRYPRPAARPADTDL